MKRMLKIKMGLMTVVAALALTAVPAFAQETRTSSVDPIRTEEISVGEMQGDLDLAAGEGEAAVLIALLLPAIQN